MGIELSGKTLGIIGCGNIGAIVADRAHGLKMKVIAYDPFLSPERAVELGVERVALDELYARADFITLHTPLTEATRNIPVSYAKRVRGNKLFGGVDTHLPIRLNTAGVIPIIFAISILLFPGVIANFLVNAKTHAIANFAKQITELFQNQTFYGVAYFILVIAFTYFYTAVIFNPEDIAENVQKQGGFIPGLRPGRNTAEFLYRVLNRITLAGAIFLGLIAVLPFLMQLVTKTQALTIGGTSLLIVVAVVIKTVKQIESQLVMRDYEGF